MKEHYSYHKGFTLLELLIALTLMAVISITATQMLRTTTTKTKKVTSTMGDLNRLRSVFSVMRSDALKAFHYRDLNMFLYKEAQKERAKRYDKRMSDWIDKYNKEEKPNPPVTVGNITGNAAAEMEKELGPRPEPQNNRPEKIVTHFKGDKEKVYFTTASGFRMRESDKISELLEVGYYLKTCTSKRYKEIESDCLWRSVSYNLDGEVTEDGEGTVLLENVEEFSLRYLGYTQTEEVEWLDSWDSTQISDNRYGAKFPAGFQVQLTVNFPRSKDGEKFKTQKLVGFFPIHHPHNLPFKDYKTPDTPQGANTPASGANTNTPNGGSTGL